MASPAPWPRFRIGFPIPAADGVDLSTDLYLPAGPDPHPAVLLRTYLGKSRHRAEALGWAKRGFACVVQDVRGRYDSGGTWRPFWHEREDAAATLDWLAGEPWFSGQAAAIGGSYAAFTAWSAALTLNPCLQAVISAVPAMQPLDLPAAHGGILPLLGHLSWWTTHGDARCAREGLFDVLLAADPGLLHHLPLATLPERMGVELPSWLEVAAGLESPPPIRDEELAALKIASLHVGGWHDPFVAESLRHFELVGASCSPRPPRQLLMGPWSHTLVTHTEALYGERAYGPESRFRLGSFEADWLRDVLTQPHEPGSTPTSGLRFFLGDSWRMAETWPLGTSEISLFAGPGLSLQTGQPPDSGTETFVYDPNDPFPARRTPIDERDLLAREDLARFTLVPPAETALRLLGTPRVVLYASTDAASTDWVVRLLEVSAEGRLLFLSQGLVENTRHLAARGEIALAEVPQRFDLEMTPIAIDLPAGHGLRLEITSSAFPSFARNPGTGENRLFARELRPARQHIHFGGEWATRLILPVLEAAALPGKEVP